MIKTLQNQLSRYYCSIPANTLFLDFILFMAQVLTLALLFFQISTLAGAPHLISLLLKATSSFSASSTPSSGQLNPASDPLRSILAALRPTKVAAGYPKPQGPYTRLTWGPQSVALFPPRYNYRRIGSKCNTSVSIIDLDASSQVHSSARSSNRGLGGPKAKIWGLGLQPM